ncbi:MAG: rRNA maturation RNase YbeY [Deltaproteobacteria bacterium]|nr:rRNA maturation RNase YbeY [Deltaproteobacteria bacterium]
MAIEIKVQPTKLKSQIKTENLQTTAKKILEYLNLAETELSLVICDDPFIRDLNKNWRNQDKATDVLSFPQSDNKQIEAFQNKDNSLFPLLLGDIIISLETAQRQAEFSLETEVCRLLIHGIAHLIGYDHKTQEEFEKMQVVEKDLLKLL